MTLLTKSAYLKGLESPRLLWIYVNDRDRLPDHDEATKDRFRQGRRVQDHAEALYDGVDLSDEDFKDNIELTRQLLSRDETVYEAGVKHDQLYTRSDIIKPVANGVELIEVKSSTSVKDYHIDDLAFQTHVLQQQGYTVKEVKLIHVNGDYERHGDIEPAKLVDTEPVTSRVQEESQGIRDRIHDMLRIIDKDQPPRFDPANIPESTHGNPLIDAFKERLDDDSVYHLYYARSKHHELHDNGVETMEDIPSHVDLTDKQQIQKEVAKTGETHVEPEKINSFLDDLSYPLCYLDFETMQDAIPLYDDTTPYQQIPFQYSLHIEGEDGAVDHHGYIDDEPGDPRRRFLHELKAALPSHGSVIVWNEWFEKHVLRGLEKSCREPIDVFDRIIDLQDPFKNFWYYHPEQRGSTSLKTVYPVLRGDDDPSYDDLNINNGDQAALQYKRSRDNPSDVLKQRLDRYCGLDTLSMKIIKDHLRTTANHT